METFESAPIEITRDWKDKLFQHKIWCNHKNRNAYKHILGGTLLVYNSFMIIGGKRHYFLTQRIPATLITRKIWVVLTCNTHIHLN